MWYYLQDNDPKHKSTMIRDWFFTQGITLLDFPPYSPDMNPIENLWAVLKSMVYRSNINNLDGLWDAAQRCWQNIPNETLKDLIASMPRRVAAVIKSKGFYTKY